MASVAQRNKRNTEFNEALLVMRRTQMIMAPTKLVTTMRNSELVRRRRKATRKIPRFPLTKQQVDDLKEAFDIFDPNGTGFVSVSELRIAIRALGYEPPKSELDDMVAMVDNTGLGRIAYADFEYLMNLCMAKNDHDSDTIKAMYLMNGGKGNGVITLEKLKQVAQELGENLNDEQLLEMLNAADMDYNATVDQQEFLAISRKLPVMKKSGKVLK